MKKNYYVTPQMKVVAVATTRLMNGSVVNQGENNQAAGSRKADNWSED